jgi:hypothetical protein
MASRPPGVTALSLFFAAGALMSGVTAVALAFPGSGLELIWRLNPPVRVAFAQLGPWGIVLMLAVLVSCLGAARGLWTGRRWGYWLAVALLVINLGGDLLNATVRADRRTLVGLPIAGFMLAYLFSRRTRDHFRPLPAQAQRAEAARPK